MDVNTGISLRNAMELNEKEDAEIAAAEKAAELAAGLSAAAASLQSPEQVLPGAGVIMQGIAAMPMPGVHRPVEFDPEINTKLLAKVAIYQEQQQAQVFQQEYEQKRRDEQAEMQAFEETVEWADQKTLKKQEAEQGDTLAHDGAINALLQTPSPDAEKVGTHRLGQGDGGSVLWQTREDKSGETVLQQVLSAIEGSSK